MTTRIPAPITAAQLTSSVATYYTTEAGKKATISALSLTNTALTADTATVYIVPSGGTASDANCVLYAHSLAPGETYNVMSAIAQTMAAGGTLQAKSGTGGSIAMVGSVYETTV